MSGSLYIILILLEAVLHGTDFTSVTAANTEATKPPSTTQSFTTTSSATVTTQAESTAETATHLNSSVTVGLTSVGISTETPQTDSPDEASSGLTAAEAAGVAVGTIAGMAALGGGIYAGLKFSGKLG